MDYSETRIVTLERIFRDLQQQVAELQAQIRQTQEQLNQLGAGT